MIDKPILFSGPMIRALLDGSKTQTRRVLKDVPEQPTADCHPKHTAKHDAPYLDAYCSMKPTARNPRGMSRVWNWWQVDDRMCLPQFKVPHAPGDRLWVREAWRARQQFDASKPSSIFDPDYVWYEADGPLIPPHFGKGRPSIFMPRWASRLTLTVTDVRVQRLQNISEEDAIAEGARLAMEPTRKLQGWTLDENYSRAMARDSFAHFWDSLNAERGFGWDVNPWVTATTITVHRCNIDHMEAPNDQT